MIEMSRDLVSGELIRGFPENTHAKELGIKVGSPKISVHSITGIRRVYTMVSTDT